MDTGEIMSTKHPTKCPLCGDMLIPSTVSHEEHDDQCRFYVFLNVPALMCGQCGDYLLSDEVVERLEGLLETAKPIKRVETPVYDFAVT
jgi:YgiT-type zinc finger domain-containing protein